MINSKIRRKHRAFVLLFFISFGLFSCTDKSNPIDSRQEVFPAVIDSLSIFALGDSYTIGISVSEDERWPNQLADTLEFYDITVREVDILARNGWTSKNLLSALKLKNIQRTYDLIGLLIGVNDQVQGYHIHDYEVNFRELLNIAIQLADNNPKRVFVLSIPDYTVTPEGRQFGNSRASEEIDAFNEINQSVSASYGVNYFYITDISRKAADREDLVAADRLHFSGKMYALWIDYLLDDMRILFKNGF